MYEVLILMAVISMNIRLGNQYQCAIASPEILENLLRVIFAGELDLAILDCQKINPPATKNNNHCSMLLISHPKNRYE
jgi:hypothetical protein